MWNESAENIPNTFSSLKIVWCIPQCFPSFVSTKLCTVSVSLCRLLCSLEINKDKLFKFRWLQGCFQSGGFFHAFFFFFYLEKVSFLLEQTSEKHSAWYFLFLLIFTSSIVDIQETKVPVLRPKGLWCLGVEERSCPRVTLLWIQSKSPTFGYSFWKYSCTLSKGWLNPDKNLLYDT